MVDKRAVEPGCFADCQ